MPEPPDRPASSSSGRGELERLTRELAAAEATQTEFLALLGHQLRNPLAPIRTLIAMLRVSDAPSLDLPYALGVMERHVAQMTRLIDDLTALSRITRDQLELHRARVTLREVVERAIAASEPVMRARGHRFRSNIVAETVLIDGDIDRMVQIVTNLLDNAAKFTAAGGRIELSAGRDRDDAVITVSDSGVGIDPVDAERVFDLNARDRHAAGEGASGLGIGLHLARQLAELHQGTLTAASNGQGQGAEFTLRIPAARDQQQAVAATALEATDRRRILVVDDNEDAADSLALLLRFSGYEVRAVYNGAEAVHAADEFRPDIALIDLGLPVLDGYQVASQIRANDWGKRMRLFALTGWGQDEARAKSERAGFDAHLVKPVDVDTLTRQLH